MFLGLCLDGLSLRLASGICYTMRLQSLKFCVTDQPALCMLIKDSYYFPTSKPVLNGAKGNVAPLGKFNKGKITLRSCIQGVRIRIHAKIIAPFYPHSQARIYFAGFSSYISFAL